jgi:hypothetical protein
MQSVVGDWPLVALLITPVAASLAFIPEPRGTSVFVDDCGNIAEDVYYEDLVNVNDPWALVK